MPLENPYFYLLFLQCAKGGGGGGGGGHPPFLGEGGALSHLSPGKPASLATQVMVIVFKKISQHCLYF